jgi:hypothetical protein
MSTAELQSETLLPTVIVAAYLSLLQSLLLTNQCQIELSLLQPTCLKRRAIRQIAFCVGFELHAARYIVKHSSSYSFKLEYIRNRHEHLQLRVAHMQRPWPLVSPVISSWPKYTEL